MIANPPSEGVEEVLAWIRREVPRPKMLPEPDATNHLRWMLPGFVHESCCPLGLLKSARMGCPSSYFYFDVTPPVPQASIREMWRWWDDLEEEEAAAAMNIVWPPQKK